jgi:hypothetical protein
MAEVTTRESSDRIEQPIGRNESVEAKRNKIRFRRADASDTREAFGNASESRPRRQRTIPREKRAEVTISDTRAEVSNKVKGKAPTLPAVEDEKETPKRGRPPTRKLKPTIDDAQNTAKFLLSAIEIVCVTTVGPTGEMTDWERGLMQAPLQRIIARTPVSVIEKGGLYVDLGFLVIGGGIYISRVFRGYKLPQFSNKKKGVEQQEDTEAPIAARANEVVDTIKAGDKDGLAVPVPNVISQHMNGAI